jgi:hypothetical protein
VGIGFASFLASAAGGFILEAHGFTTLFVTYAAIPLVGIMILAVFGRRLVPPLPERSLDARNAGSRE